ncbi:unnamed protein product, partial [Phaeothamnion confervicola]
DGGGSGSWAAAATSEQRRGAVRMVVSGCVRLVAAEAPCDDATTDSAGAPNGGRGYGKKRPAGYVVWCLDRQGGNGALLALRPASAAVPLRQHQRQQALIRDHRRIRLALALDHRAAAVLMGAGPGSGFPFSANRDHSSSARHAVESAAAAEAVSSSIQAGAQKAMQAPVGVAAAATTAHPPLPHLPSSPELPQLPSPPLPAFTGYAVGTALHWRQSRQRRRLLARPPGGLRRACGKGRPVAAGAASIG